MPAPSLYLSMPAITVNHNGVLKLLRGLQVHKATVPDQIPTRLLKELSAEIAPVLAVFFQASLGQGVISNDWKTANVAPVFKKGEKNRPEKYHPVSLSFVMCKLLNHIVCSNIMRHADTHRILTDARHGFRYRRS